MNQTDKPIANPIVVLREEFDDWAVLFNPDTGDAVGTNPVGVAVWKRMDGKKSIADIVSDVKNSFDDTPDAIFEEILAFVDRLDESGFVGLELEWKANNGCPRNSRTR
jgi:SynChlorMet cassette protein ScmD